ncbi:major facilitator superfamily domain-containing protein [Apodospora peruviana]|uniref:Major facilitator superfamily domain-containing protein n=1 Tax=Apodospora peruviana TaxID=516989 RepID=A0AAE0IRJ2_9PEZI|nr:major facilitator superfamily domain-containing protein [Apodospora peruviana]
MADAQLAEHPAEHSAVNAVGEKQAASTALPKCPQDETSATVAKDDGQNYEYVTGFKLAIIVASVALACFLMLVDTMVISTAIPRITDEFRSLTDVGWYASAYQFGIAAPQPLIGKVYTHFSTKWTFLACFAVFELGSVLCGAALSSTMLIVGRAVAGLGAAGIINGAITIVSSCAPLEKRPIQQLGLVVGPLIGGALTSYSTWRWSFYINVPIGAVVALAITLLPIPEQTPKEPPLSVLPQLHHHLDLVGFVLFAPAVIQLLLALQYAGNQFPWNSSQVIGLFCGSAATCAVWFLWNGRKGDAALLPPAMVSRRTVWTAAVFNAFQMAAIYGVLYYLPIYFQAVKDTSPVLSGVYIMPTFLTQLLMAGISGGILQKMGYVIPLAIFATVLLSIGTGLLSILGSESSTGQWIGFQILTGVGSGAGLQLAIIAIQGVTAGEELSSGMAFMVFTQSLFPAVLLALCNLILVESLKKQLTSQAVGALSGESAEAVIRAGATRFRTVIAPKELQVVLRAYANSIDRVFYVVAVVAAVSSLFLWGMGWQDLRKKKDGAHPGKVVMGDSASPSPEGEGKA